MSKWDDWSALIAKRSALRGIAADIIEVESVAEHAIATEQDRSGYEHDEYEMEVDGAEDALDMLEEVFNTIKTVLIEAKRI